MNTRWVETNERRPANIRRVYSLMHDSHTAMVGVFERTDGKFRIVWSRAGAGFLTPPEVEDTNSLDEAKSRAEEIARTQLIQPRTVILNS